MIRGSTKIFLETLGGIVVAALVLAGFAVWRLGTGPISIDDITPYIENALSDETSGRRVIIGSSSLVWDRTDHAIEVRTDRVTVFDGDGLAVVVVPEMSVRFSLAALLRGDAVPRAVSLVRPAFTVIRTADGAWEFSAVPEADPGIDADTLARPGDTAAVARQIERSLAPLERVRLVDARLVVDDRRADATWVLPRVSATLQRRGGQITGMASVVLEVDGAEVPLRATGRLDPNLNLIEGDLTIADLVPAKLARRLVELEPLTALDLPLGGSLHVVGRGDGDKPAFDFKLTGGAGQIVRPELVGGALPVASLSLAGRYVVAGERLTIDQLSVALPTTSLTASLTARELTGNVAVEGMLALPGIPLDDLRKYWPPEVGTNPRRWILANMSQGAIRDLTVRFAGKRVDGVVEVSTVEGQMAVDGARVRYLPPQPPIEQVAGQVRFNHRQFDIAVQRGQLRGIKIENAQLTISGLEDRDQVLALEVAAAGPLGDTMALLDLPPFGYLKRFGRTAQDIAGEHTTRLKLRFPLIDKLTLDDVDMSVIASLSDVRVAKVVSDLDLTGGRLELKLDKASMAVNGDAEIGGVPATVAWTERFERSPPFRRRYDVSTTVNDAQRRKLGFDLGDYLSGPIAVKADYVEALDRRARLSGTFDLRGAVLKVEDLGWTKKAGEPAGARLDAAFQDDRLTTLESAELTGGGLSARASGAFGAGGRLTRLDVQQLKVGDTDVAARVQWQGERLDVAVTGRSVDATALIASDDPTSKPPRAMTVSAQVDRVIVGAQRQIERVDLRAMSDGTRWRTASMSAGVVGGGNVSLKLEPRNGRRELTMMSDDAGTVMKTLDVTDNMQGGRLRLEGHFDDSAAGDKLTAQLTVEEFRMVRAPVLAKLLAVASITGIPELMSNDGIAFQELSMQMVRQSGRMEIVDARASGNSVGLTMQGTIQGADDVAELTGTIVPISSVNSLVSRIPVIGDIITGGGGGLFAFTYRVTGPLNNPSVSVNPLSVLAPGFVRNLFHWLPSLGAPKGDAAPPPMSNQQ